MLVKKYRLLWCPIVLLALCNGCSNDSTATKNTPVADADSYQNSTPANRQDNKARQGKIQGKPGAQISLAHNQVYRLEPGVEAGISISLRAPYTEGEMHVNVKPGDGLMLLGETTDYVFTLAAGQEYAIPLQLVAADAGRYYLSMHVRVVQGEREIFKAISAIVQAGSDSDRVTPAVEFEKASGSDGVISLPAQEIIIQE